LGGESVSTGKEVRLWRIDDGNNLREIPRSALDVEARLEDWLAQDISILDHGLLVIGRQVETDFGGFIDLLCLDGVGDLVVVELKRDRTPREITAQTLDYGSWVKNLSNDRIIGIAESYLGQGRLEEAFKRRFGVDLPETLNEDHRLLIVGAEIDASSERIIKYLSEGYGVNINAATFQYFKIRTGQNSWRESFSLSQARWSDRVAPRGHQNGDRTSHTKNWTRSRNRTGSLSRTSPKW
jgi:hypothetical protein